MEVLGIVDQDFSPSKTGLTGSAQRALIDGADILEPYALLFSEYTIRCNFFEEKFSSCERRLV